MPPPKQQRRRALELLEASIDGCTEAIMLAYGFKTELWCAGPPRCGRLCGRARLSLVHPQARYELCRSSPRKRASSTWPWIPAFGGRSGAPKGGCDRSDYHAGSPRRQSCDQFAL